MARIAIEMPKLGYDMETGIVSGWLKKVGDPIARGEAIAEIETDKATVEMEATASGTLVEIVHEAGDEVAIGVAHRLSRRRRVVPVVPTVDPPLAGRVALVTGGASGIGRAIARELDSRGARVAVVDLDAAAAGSVAADLERGFSLGCDVSDPAACDSAVSAVREVLGPIDILVNDAGLQHIAPIESFPIDRWRYLHRRHAGRAVRVDPGGPPDDVFRGWGRIINLGSIHSLVASSNKSAYTAAKARGCWG